ncbi:MAG: 4a-hydroxytetrahydrobiopterin dehydratase [Candidatus Neomarinimicrobiota bacterium]|nr:MAG: 4a-hydroxytetrahydrobiopterin dehydratase [Candidatus Neomarinimicrobiota bacterium]
MGVVFHDDLHSGVGLHRHHLGPKHLPESDARPDARGMKIDSRLKPLLGSLRGWEVKEGGLEKTIPLPSYQQGLEWVNQIAREAENRNHHPDLIWTYHKLTLRLMSHDRGRITRRDVEFARWIDSHIGSSV